MRLFLVARVPILVLDSIVMRETYNEDAISKHTDEANGPSEAHKKPRQRERERKREKGKQRHKEMFTYIVQQYD